MSAYLLRAVSQRRPDDTTFRPLIAVRAPSPGAQAEPQLFKTSSPEDFPDVVPYAQRGT